MKTIAIAIPCYNEEDGVPSLGVALLELSELLKNKYFIKWLFIDDGSVDNTYLLLSELTKKLENAYVFRHEQNKNLGAALQTAILNAGNCDLIGYLDSDCTYSPKIILPLLEKLEQTQSELVTASPYHPAGEVLGVPAWRLFLSKGLSFIYRILTGAKIHTFTAMVRVQTASSAKLTLSTRTDFTFVTEVMLNYLRLGLKVDEVPAILSQRSFGVSKMKTLNTIRAQIELIINHLINSLGGTK